MKKLIALTLFVCNSLLCMDKTALLDEKYPLATEINKMGTKFSDLCLPATCDTLAIGCFFRSEELSQSVYLPASVVALTPDGCFKVPLNIEHIKTALEQKDQELTLSKSVLRALAKLHPSPNKAHMSWMQSFRHRPLPQLNMDNLLLLGKEGQADELTSTKISWKTLDAYKESQEERL